jgi:hypothetical protein
MAQVLLQIVSGKRHINSLLHGLQQSGNFMRETFEQITNNSFEDWINLWRNK